MADTATASSGEPLAPTMGPVQLVMYRRLRTIQKRLQKIAIATTAAARRRRISSGDGKSSFRRIGFSRVGTRGGARNDGDTHSAIVCVG